MAQIRLTREFSFEMAHALDGYDGACSQIHGHSYRLFVTIKGEPSQDASSPKYGMLMDFGLLKKLVNEHIVERYDHALLIRATAFNTALREQLTANFERIEHVDYQPTCEMLVERFAAMLQEKLPSGVSLFSLRLDETARSYAEWFAADN